MVPYLVAVLELVPQPTKLSCDLLCIHISPICLHPGTVVSTETREADVGGPVMIMLAFVGMLLLT